MQKLKLLFLFLLFSSCSDPCEGLECLSDEAFAFTLKSVDTGEELLAGDDPQLAEVDIEIFYMLNGNKEAAHVQFWPDHITIYLKDDVQAYFVHALNKTDTITVDLSHRAASGCCPSTTEVEKISLNGKETGKESWIIDLYR